MQFLHAEIRAIGEDRALAGDLGINDRAANLVVTLDKDASGVISRGMASSRVLPYVLVPLLVQGCSPRSPVTTGRLFQD